MILQQFKMACLQYKPSSVMYKETLFGREEILEMKKKMISDLEEITGLIKQRSYLTLDMSIAGANNISVNENQRVGKKLSGNGITNLPTLRHSIPPTAR